MPWSIVLTGLCVRSHAAQNYIEFGASSKARLWAECSSEGDGAGTYLNRVAPQRVLGLGGDTSIRAFLGNVPACEKVPMTAPCHHLESSYPSLLSCVWTRPNSAVASVVTGPGTINRTSYDAGTRHQYWLDCLVPNASDVVNNIYTDTVWEEGLELPLQVTIVHESSRDSPLPFKGMPGFDVVTFTFPGPSPPPAPPPLSPPPYCDLGILCPFMSTLESSGIPTSNFKRICYNAPTVNSMSASAFHSGCNGQGASLMLARFTSSSPGSTYGKRFVGAYMPLSWHSNNNYMSTGSAVLFRFEPKSSNACSGQTPTSQCNFKKWTVSSAQYAGYGGSNYGPTYGGGHDLYIDNSMTKGYCNIGHSYTGCSGSSSDCQTEFCGS